MSRLFDAYIIVDWSASAKPVTGANSIWIGMRARGSNATFQFHSANPSTRLKARRIILEMVDAQIARGDRVFVGFDFALGYPAGTAAAIGLTKGSAKSPWQVMHDHLTELVIEHEDNSNDRFTLASRLNEAISNGPHPFWGAPVKKVVASLSSKKGDFTQANSGGLDLAEHRLSEAWIRSQFKARPKSVWQLLGVGSVGSQALLGIPSVSYLRAQLPGARLWPFETGFRKLTSDLLEDTSCVFAEVYPSTVEVVPMSGETLDEAQVRTLSERLESLDSRGELASAFAPPDSLSSCEIHTISTEEGWILAK